MLNKKRLNLYTIIFVLSECMLYLCGQPIRYKNMNRVLFVSDLDYSFNPVSGEYDIPSVEWQAMDGGTWWSSYGSEEERNAALDANNAYNEQPHIKRLIEEYDIKSDIFYADMSTAELFEHAMNESVTVELFDAIQFAGYTNDRVRGYIASHVCKHNKLIMRSRVQPKQATFSLGELMR